MKNILYIGFVERAGRGYGARFTVVSVGYSTAHSSASIELASKPARTSGPSRYNVAGRAKCYEVGVLVWVTIIDVSGGKRVIFFLGLLLGGVVGCCVAQLSRVNDVIRMVDVAWYARFCVFRAHANIVAACSATGRFARRSEGSWYLMNPWWTLPLVLRKQ